jgi:hypothetical protein
MHIHSRKLIAGALVAGVLGGAGTVRSSMPPEYNDMTHQSRPIPSLSNDHRKVYPIKGADGKLEWPLFFSVHGYDQDQGKGQVFDPTTTQMEIAMNNAEIISVDDGEVTCPDGTTRDYTAVGTVAIKELQYQYCDNSKQQAKITDLENASKEDDEKQQSGDKTGRPKPPAPPSKDKPAPKPPSGGGDKPKHKESHKPEATGCFKYTTGKRLLCEELKYEGIYYRYNAGHLSLKAFKKMCPNPRKHPGRNTKHGAPPDRQNEWVSGNPNPCATDCSGIYSLAFQEAFAKTMPKRYKRRASSPMDKAMIWNVAGIKHSYYTKRIPFNKVREGDIVTIGANDHIETVVSRHGHSVKTFGSHRTETMTGFSVGTLGYGPGDYDAAYRLTHVGKK